MLHRRPMNHSGLQISEVKYYCPKLYRRIKRVKNLFFIFYFGHGQISDKSSCNQQIAKGKYVCHKKKLMSLKGYILCMQNTRKLNFAYYLLIN
jgi:GTP-dependent phosphoenolpyruvate carboxykinase